MKTHALSLHTAFSPKLSLTPALPEATLLRVMLL